MTGWRRAVRRTSPSSTRRLAAVADYVAEVTREAYPDLTHSLSQPLAAFRRRAASIAGSSLHSDCLARSASSGRAPPIDLATVSVLLDAGAGDAWRYRGAGDRADVLAFRRAGGREPRHVRRRRIFQSDPRSPWRADGVALERIERRDAGAAFSGRRRTIHWLDSSGAPRCCAASAQRSSRPSRLVRRGARASRQSVDHVLRTSSGNRIAAADDPRHAARRPVADLAVRAWCCAASRSATRAATRRSAPATTPTRSCRSTSCRSG